jgi:hypothetical protein
VPLIVLKIHLLVIHPGQQVIDQETNFRSTSNFVIMKRLFIYLLTVFIFSFFFISCYYDSEEVLYPSFACDTTNVTYHTKIVFLMDDYCTNCHGNPPLQNSISLTTYDEVKSYAQRITPAIKHTGLYPMPKNGGKLNDCAIRAWDLWMLAGMPE